MKKLSREEFQDALKKGLGRAVAHVRNSPPESVREDLLHACLNSLAYDFQLECPRAPWLCEMIRLTGETEYYRQKIFDAWFNSPDESFTTCNNYQLFQLMGQFFIHGYAQAREEVYRIFDWQFTAEDFTGYPYSFAVDEIIEADGIAGLIHIIERIGLCIHDGKDIYLSPDLIEKAKKKHGEETIRQALQTEAEHNEFVRLYLEHPKTKNDTGDESERPRETKEQREERMRNEYPLREYIDSFLDDDFSKYKDDEQFIENPYHFLIRKQRFPQAGRCAVEEDINYALDKIFLTDDPLRKTVLLRTFYERPLPRVETRFLDILDSENEELAWTAGIVLSKISHPLIREKAIEALKSDPPKIDWPHGIIFGSNSFLCEDVKLLETSLLTKTIPKHADLESVGIHLKEIYRRFPGDHFKAIYLWLYEHGPCSFCRDEIVETLIDNHWCTPEIIEECRFDCNSDIREQVQKLPSPDVKANP